jgi:hypothetical protein
VRIRRRKPCVLARRRLLGWNVRLLTRGLPDWWRSCMRTRRWRSCLAPRGARVSGESWSAARKARGRRGTGRRTQGGHGAAAVDDSTGPRYGRRPPRVKRVRAQQPPPPTCHRRRSQPAHRHDTPGPGPGPTSTRQKNVAAGCGQPLAGGAAASLVSRGSPDVSPAGRHRRSPRHRPGARCRGPGGGVTEQDGPGQPMYTGCGRPCGRRPGSAPATRLGRLAPMIGTMLGTQSPPPGPGPVTTDTVRTARTLGGTTA